MKMMYGCLSTGGPSHFITTTYLKLPGGPTRNAADVAKDWAELWRLLKTKEQWRDAAWVKVPELTKAGQVHLHGIVVRAAGTDSCRKGDYHRKRWMMSECSVGCLEHDLARAWYEITKDSFVVDCQEVRSVAGTAAYVQKYMGKDMGGDRTALKSLGFNKRWSSSKNWPRCEPLRLRGTVEEEWTSIRRVKGSKGYYYDDNALDHEWRITYRELAESQKGEKLALLESVGGSYMIEMRRLSEKRRNIKDAMRGFGIELEVA